MATVDVSELTWGVYDDQGQPIANYDTFYSVKVDDNSKVSDFPVEDGAFVDYNKVNLPNKVMVTLVAGGSRTKTSAFLDALKEARRSTALFAIVTPEDTFSSMTLEKFDYKREAVGGQSMIKAQCAFLEVRQVTPQYATVALPAVVVKKPSSASEVDTGKQQDQEPAQPDVADLSYDQIRERARTDAQGRK